jgi:hypothetical protein
VKLFSIHLFVPSSIHPQAVTHRSISLGTERETKSCKVFVGFCSTLHRSKSFDQFSTEPKDSITTITISLHVHAFFEIPVEGKRHRHVIKKHMRIFAKGHKLAQIDQSIVRQSLASLQFQLLQTMNV